MQEALFVSCRLRKVFQINQFACKWQSGSLMWNRAIESETHSMIHALAHTQRHWNYLFFCPAGKPTYSSPWQPQEWKKMPWCLKEKWPVKSQPYPCTACSSGFSVTLSHMDRLIWTNTELESAHAWLQHIWACINDYTYMGLYKPHTGQINNADPLSQVNMKWKMQPILLVQYDVFLRDTEY